MDTDVEMGINVCVLIASFFLYKEVCVYVSLCVCTVFIRKLRIIKWYVNKIRPFSESGYEWVLEDYPQKRLIPE